MFHWIVIEKLEKKKKGNLHEILYVWIEFEELIKIFTFAPTFYPIYSLLNSIDVTCFHGTTSSKRTESINDKRINRNDKITFSREQYIVWIWTKTIIMQTSKRARYRTSKVSILYIHTYVHSKDSMSFK